MTDDIVKSLEKLCALREQGLLDDIEFSRAKEALLKEKKQDQKTSSREQSSRCNNCGAIVDSLASECSDCGNEIRRSADVGDKGLLVLQARLDEIASDPKWSTLVKTFGTEYVQYDQRGVWSAQATVVSAFTVPNNKDDIVELISIGLANSIPGQLGVSFCGLAWQGKVEQAILKGRAIASGDATFIAFLDGAHKKHAEYQRLSDARSPFTILKYLLIGGAAILAIIFLQIIISILR